MANKSTKGNLPKTIIMKANLSPDGFTQWERVVKEYQAYKDTLSKWVAQNLTAMKIGDLLPYLDKYSKKTNKETGERPVNVYYQLCEQHKDEPLYKLFTYDSNSRNNAMYEIIRKTNCDGYKGNILGISETHYRRNGFVKNILANYTTKISTLELSERKRKIDSDSPEDLIRSQVVYEMQKNNIKDAKGFKSIIEYLKSKKEVNIQYLERLQILYEYFKNHENEIKEYITLAAVEQLKSFGGVRVNNEKSSMNLEIQGFSITRVDGACTYILHLPINGKIHGIKLWGNRQVVVNKDGTPVDILDLTNQHGSTINITIKNGEIYFAFTVTSDFVKPEHQIKNVVGVDVNTKHMLMQSNITDNGNVKGYFNIYKVLVEDRRFTSLLSEEQLKYFCELANIVSFCPIETEFLFARYAEYKKMSNNAEMRQIEKVFSDILDEQYKKYKDIDTSIANYISYVRKLRSQCCAYFKLKMKYKELQRQFDKEQDYKDLSTESKETMDKRRWENPFRNTPEASKLIKKMDNVSRQLIGCRDNIITYAYRVFEKNGYDTISLENLESSQFENNDHVIAPKSLLEYHHLKGKTMNYLLSDECKVRITTKDGKVKEWYHVELNDKDEIDNIFLTPEGETEKEKNLFNNMVIKIVHFADIKDKFIQLGNYNKLQTVLVPSYFTSQMDSKTHSVYVVETANTKTSKKELKLVSKKRVRRQQEWHINGLNADYNAACNIAHIAKNIELRQIMCKTPQTKNGYSSPVLTSKVKSQVEMVRELKKMGKTILYSNDSLPF